MKNHSPTNSALKHFVTLHNNFPVQFGHIQMHPAIAPSPAVAPEVVEHSPVNIHGCALEWLTVFVDFDCDHTRPPCLGLLFLAGGCSSPDRLETSRLNIETSNRAPNNYSTLYIWRFLAMYNMFYMPQKISFQTALFINPSPQPASLENPRLVNFQNQVGARLHPKMLLQFGNALANRRLGAVQLGGDFLNRAVLKHQPCHIDIDFAESRGSTRWLE
jgi:hypothetical protein